MSKIIKWGILGCGRIAYKFVEGLKILPDAILEGVASKTEGKAESFGKTFGVKNTYNNYEELVKNPAVDVIYIATTHNFHYKNALLCLNHGKPVLCEKPITLNAIQAEELINTARNNNVFLMEAMWTRFLPCIVKLNEFLDEGLLGEIQHVTANFGIKKELDHKVRSFNPDLGGGALLDLGVYPISFARMIYKQAPSKIKSSAYIGKTKVDEKSCYLFEYENGQTAMLSSSHRLIMPHDASIFGTKGYLEIPNFYHPSKMILKLEGKRKKKIRIPFKSTGYNYEAREVMHCLNTGKFESEIMPLDETLEIMKTMDILRSQWHLKYPGE
ncbi:MAG: Gfo/Idh/MocA family oxidoreductase [Candidatus Lokiarchaeota archaeon]|nr:Gfo/Idh/MocA family oxidoreductase [Candidatus Lokiarchaeota archaeon]